MSDVKSKRAPGSREPPPAHSASLVSGRFLSSLIYSLVQTRCNVEPKQALLLKLSKNYWCLTQLGDKLCAFFSL